MPTYSRVMSTSQGPASACVTTPGFDLMPSSTGAGGMATRASLTGLADQVDPPPASSGPIGSTGGQQATIVTGDTAQLYI